MAKGGDDKGRRREIAIAVAMKHLASSSTATGDDNGYYNDSNWNGHSLFNKWLKVTDNGSKGSSCESNGGDRVKIGEGDEEFGDNNNGGDMDLALKMMDD